jgi:hypothetical protein
MYNIRVSDQLQHIKDYSGMNICKYYKKTPKYNQRISDAV